VITAEQLRELEAAGYAFRGPDMAVKDGKSYLVDDVLTSLNGNGAGQLANALNSSDEPGQLVDAVNTSWSPVDLSGLVTGEGGDPGPALIVRTDGRALLYA
jgi:hypothetical protein